jgi:hypothetical protein
MATHYLPTPPELVMQGAQTNVQDTQAPLEPDAYRRLDGLFDLTDGYYTLGIREDRIDFFTVNYRGTLHRLAGLPMGWK